jgi:hypothetical protein
MRAGSFYQIVYLLYATNLGTPALRMIETDTKLIHFFTEWILGHKRILSCHHGARWDGR